MEEGACGAGAGQNPAMRASNLRRFAPAATTVLAFALFASGVAVPVRGEIFVGSDTEILVFADDADGDVVPLRKISGILTELPAVFTLAADRVHRELWVSGCLGIPSILVFGMDDEGDVSPRRRISGAATGLVNACSTILDLVHDEVYVVDAAGAVRVFPRLADGDVAPTRTITGAATGLTLPTMGYLDLVHDELYVATSSGAARVRVFARTASGDVAPIRTLTLSASPTGNPRGLLVDLENDELIVVDLTRVAVRFYPRTASGTTAMLREIRGAATLLNAPHQTILTDGDELLIGNEVGATENFVGHARTAVGNATPTRLVTAIGNAFGPFTGITTDRARNCSEGNSVDGCVFRDNFEGADTRYWSSAVDSFDER